MQTLSRQVLNLIEETHHRALGRCVKQRRGALGWSQAILAARTGLSRSEIQYIERGLRHPKSGTMRRLCAAFGISYMELMAQAERVERELAEQGA